MTIRPPDEWTYGRALSAKDAADVLGVSTHTLSRWSKSGMIGFFRLPGGDRRYPECEIHRIMRGEPVPDFVRERAKTDAVEARQRWDDGHRRNEFMAERVRKAAASDDDE